MDSARSLYRANLALGAFGWVAVAVAFAIASTGLTVKAPQTPDPASMWCTSAFPFSTCVPAVLLLVTTALVAATVARATSTIAREWWAVRRSRRRITAAERRTIAGAVVDVVDEPRPAAMCIGFRKPAIVITTGALANLGADEISAMVTHERHHQIRREPLRLAVSRVLGHAFFFLPALGRCSERYATLTELAADDAAVASAHTPRPVAAAMLAVTEIRPGPEPRVGIDPERVDHLLGARPRWRVPLKSTVASVAAALALVGAAATGVALLHGAEVNVAGAVTTWCTLAMTIVTLLALFAAPRLVGIRRRKRGRRRTGIG